MDAAIRREDDLASVNHDVAKIDLWEQACFGEDEIPAEAKATKENQEDALCERIFGSSFCIARAPTACARAPR
ncbi:hypothetical protein K9U39_08100 [Rhodoblastus acidophilus]|uniref:Uncharacterized protein n=1 Tax=Candidatus Rhodoblastus alkanivorans TaxID=2954117 RepID=A0ABS9Z7M6_9HYPH|nr:hypothetical protein [Candidatus Rhodoblastus alkanivorans]MCI4678333.1 hypothetical protein [Candidatus Rhodoblastus alkanivorans]MCI4683591.1 hypothetical protein [Candidatus Rhodoblastus alkanivorans]MDI4640907.1 hypothetical protein [Rhodoblastus acidophilus]